MAPAPPPPATGTSFQTYPSLTRSCFSTFSAAASPPEVHQCSICSSLLSAAFAAVAKPRTEAAIALVNSRLRSFIVLPSKAHSPTGFGPAPLLEALRWLPIFLVQVRSAGAGCSCTDLCEHGSSPSDVAERRRTLGTKRRDAFGQVLCHRRQPAREPLDRCIEILAFSKVYHRLDDL